MIGLAATVTVGAGSVFFCVRRLLAVLRVEDPAAAVRRLRRADASELSRVLGTLPEGSEVRRIVAAFRSSPVREHVVSELNECLSEVDDDLSRMASVPGAVARISAMTALMVLIVVVARGLEKGEVVVPHAVAIVTIGFTAALVCVVIGREADRRSQERRAGYNELVRLLMQRVPAQGSS